MRITQLLKSLSACLLLSVLCAQPAMALQQTRDSHADSRIKYATYRSDEVFPVLTKEGFVTTISFEKDEEVTSYGSGYSSAWETATSENQFFLKPKTLDGETNFVIVTNKRVYSLRCAMPRKAKVRPSE
nr:TrbG/VirB9 family P-type conjugative transfer protein [Parasutterella excrementihominis]